MNLADFHFLRPELFLALLPLTLLWVLSRQQEARSSWSAVCDPHLLPYILSGGATSNSRIISVSLLLGTFFALLALSGPTWNKLPQPVFRPQSALVILLDLSHSMDCPDLSPSRLTRASYKVADILQRRKEGQTALIVFAGDAYTVTPLTNDTNTILSLLGTIKTDIMPSQGSRVDLAIENAVKLIQQAGLHQGELLLIGDGFTDQRSLTAAEQIAKQGYQLSVLAVGTPDGAPISTGDGFLQDRNGTIIIPQLNEAALRDLASRGGGSYQRIRVDDRDIDSLLVTSERHLRQSEAQQTEQLADRWQDQGYWLLLPLLPLTAFAFRRGVIFCFLLLLPLATPAQAIDLENLWQTPDQQAAKQLQQGNAAAAAKQFNDPHWQAVANYRAGHYQQTVESLKELADGTSLYNKGNALAQMGQYPAAIQTYEQILKDDPNYPDALHNKELLQRLLEEKSQQQQDQQQNQGEENQQQQDQSGQNQQQKSDDEKSAEQSPPSEDSDQAEQSEQNPGQQAPEQQDPTDKKQHTEQNQAKSQAEQTEVDNKENPTTMSATAEDTDPQHQADERWLEQIPDDPGNLLKRKFLYQYRQRQTHDEEKPW